MLARFGAREPWPGLGRTIEAFGEVTFRGIEVIVFRCRLAALHSLFPHNDDATIKNVNSASEDVLHRIIEVFNDHNMGANELYMLTWARER